MNPQDRLHELLPLYDLPGASVAVLDDGKISRFSAGLANIVTGTAVSGDTIFPIGSITKVFTTTLIMQLVENGLLDLDRPVVDYLPGIQSDGGCLSDVSVRNLLTHTSGIPGDYLFDPGTASDVVERFVRQAATLPALHQPGSLFSYSNSAFILAGYLVERLTGKSWHEVIRTQLTGPLALRSMTTFPADRTLDEVGVPHRRDEATGRIETGDMWPEFHAGAPAGFTPYATASDVVAFAALHLNRGQDRSGATLIHPSSIEAMQRAHVTSLPSGAFDAEGWGLGWALHRYGTERVLGHNGGTSAMLRVLPDRAYAVAVLTNISGGIRLGQQLIGELVSKRFGIDFDPPPALSETDNDTGFEKYEGVFEHLEYRVTIRARGNQLFLQTGSRNSPSKPETPLLPLEGGSFQADFSDRGASRVGFAKMDAAGVPEYFQMGLRAYRRVRPEHQVAQQN